MGKLGCKCGHVIVDQTDNLSCKADLLPDQHQQFLYDDIPSALAGLVEAIQQGRRTEWIRRHFSDEYPTDLTDESLIADLISRRHLNVYRRMYQCDNCGRLWVQMGKTKRYASFLPEDETGRNILKRDL